MSGIRTTRPPSDGKQCNGGFVHRQTGKVIASRERHEIGPSGSPAAGPPCSRRGGSSTATAAAVAKSNETPVRPGRAALIAQHCSTCEIAQRARQCRGSVRWPRWHSGNSTDGRRYPEPLTSAPPRRPARRQEPLAVLRRIDLRGAADGTANLAAVLPRAALDVTAAVEAVRPICADVRDRGVTAVLDATACFDGVALTDLRVPATALAAAHAALDPAVRAALVEAIRRTRLVHEAQRRADVTVAVADGSTVTERWVPVRRV